MAKQVDSFFLSFIEFLRSVVGDSGFMQIDLGSKYGGDRIVINHGNQEITFSIAKKDIETGEENDD